MFSGKEAKTVITHTSGGSLVQDLGDRTGKVPEYSVSDLQQISSNEDVKFMVTNEEGELVDMDKRYVNDFGRYRMSVGDDVNGNPMPYRGGVFMVVKKADGTLFPMKLSINKNTAEQAEVLADMIIQSMVADNKDGKSNLSFQTPLSLLPEDLRASIESQMGLEIEVLKEDEKDDPKMIDIINMFAYVSDRTSGYTSQLYAKKGVLHFGIDGQTISREEKNNPESRAQLIEFLTNVKRRQFSLDMYNKFPKYHDFIIDNKIVSTNSTITEPLFQSDFSYIDGVPSGRRVQAYVKPIHKPKVKKSDADITAADIILPTVEERSVQKDLGPDRNSESKYYMELTEKIKEAFPNKDYWSLDEVLSDGVYVVKTFKGVTVPRKKLIELENFKTEFFKSKGVNYTSKFVSIKEQNNIPAPAPKSTQQPAKMEDSEKEMLNAELEYLEKTFGKEMADVYFQGIEPLPKKNQEELDRILSKLKPTQQDSDRKTFDSLGEELELQGNEIYYKDTEEGEGGLHSDYDTAEEAAKAFKSLSQPAKQTGGVEDINIYAGTNENAELSNFANRPFKYKGRSYKNVEQAFQHQKLMTSAPNGVSRNYLNNEVGQKILKSKNGAEAKKLGRQIKELNVNAWDRISSSVMKDLIKESFKQNPNALSKLIDTGNANLTHTQDKGKWGKLFPKILMEVREELGSPNVNDTEVRNTQENVVPSQESEADARKRLLERSKKRTRGTGRRTASRKETEKSPRVTLIEKKSDFENLNPGKINKDCKG